MRSRLFFALHRWVSALAFLQLAAWTLSGLFFAVIPIGRIRGGAVKGAHQTPLSQTTAPLLPPADAMNRLRSDLPELLTLELRANPTGLFYIGRTTTRAARLDARTGERAPVQQVEAEEIARRDQQGRPLALSSQLITGQPPIEYRGRPLPAWRIVLGDGAGTVIYVDAETGEVTARRNNLWRIYDFLWSLHIMDYRERESFNHPLLIAAALIGLLTVISGATLWSLRLSRRLRRRRGMPPEQNQ